MAEELHFGRAAARLHLAQPALTKQIQQLEATLGVVLFDRSHRQVTLTDTGRAFLPEARRILNQMDNAARAARRASVGESGLLRIGFSSSAPYGLFPHIILGFRTRYPLVSLDMHEIWSAEQSEALLLDRLDVGFAQRPQVDSEILDFELVHEEPVVAAVPVDHPLAAESLISLSDLSGDEFLLFPRNRAPWWFDEVISACRRAGFSPRAAVEVTEITATLGLVAAGMGVAILPESVRCLSREGVKYLRLSEQMPVFRTVAAWRRDNDAPVLAAFLGVVRQVTRASGVAGSSRRWHPEASAVRWRRLP